MEKINYIIEEVLLILAKIRDFIYRKIFYSSKKVTIGKYTYGAPKIYFFNDNTCLEIGKYCSISAKVVILLGGEHRADWITTYPFSVMIKKYHHIKGFPHSKGDVVIGNDVWIGYGVMIMSSVTIGDGAVIGANSVVTRDIPPYAIAVGNPAKVIRYRFDKDTVDKLLEYKWWNFDDRTVDNIVPLLLNNDIDPFMKFCEKYKNSQTNVEYSQDYTDYQTNRSTFRKVIRQIYLNHTLKLVKGKCIDFGCGVGELLAKLPNGSLGLEINKSTVEYCKNIGLNVEYYNPETDKYMFSDYENKGYKTLIISHVLEHLENPDKILKSLAGACNRIGIERIIVIVPCYKGFQFDKTHKTFIDINYFDKNDLDNIGPYKVIKKKYFPFNFLWVGEYFTYNELIILLDCLII